MSLLYKRDNSPYFYVTKTRQSTKTINRKDAEEFARKALKDLWREEALGEKTRTWAALCEAWADAKTNKKTLYVDITHMDDMSKYLARTMRLDDVGSLKLTELTADVVRQYGAQVRLRATESTANRSLATIRAMLNLAAEYEWIARAPKVKKYALPKKDKKVKYLTLEQFGEVCKHLPDYAVQLFTISLQTGLRFANAKGLRWSWLTSDGRIAHIPADETKTARMYTVPLNAVARAVVEAQRGKDAEFVFEQHSYDHYRYLWDTAIKVSKVPVITIHGLRHTFASLHAMAGTPFPVLAEMGGWEGTKMLTEVYAHLSTAHVESFADNLNGVLPNK